MNRLLAIHMKCQALFSLKKKKKKSFKLSSAAVVIIASRVNINLPVCLFRCLVLFATCL